MQNSSSSHRSGSGGAFFLLSLFAGVLGGAMGLPFMHVHPSAGVVVSHAVLMTFYVVCPAFLGGMASWFLPGLLGGEGMALPLASRLAFACLLPGVFLLPVAPFIGLALWTFGVLALSCNVIATVLEMRSLSFRALSPLVWAFLGNALSVLVIAPVLLAFLLRSHMEGGGPGALLAVLRGGVEASLLSVPSLGIIAAALLPQRDGEGRVARLAPYVFSIMALVPVLCWADHLFGGMGSTAYRGAQLAGLVVPCLVFLAGLAVDLWRVRMPSGAAASWASGGLVLLLAGWLATLTAPLWPQASPAMAVFILGGGGHQLVMFGSLLALGAAFYGWCAARLVRWTRFLGVFGTAHALVTFAGALCSILPQLALPAVLLMGGSLLMFALLAGMLWYGMLTARAQGMAAISHR